MSSGDVIVVTTPYVPGYRVVEVRGIVVGVSVRTRGLGGRIAASLEALVGGRGTAYAREIEKARREALEDMVRKARELGANAVIGVDFETSEILEGFIVVTATGTAVVVERCLEGCGTVGA